MKRVVLILIGFAMARNAVAWTSYVDYEVKGNSTGSMHMANTVSDDRRVGRYTVTIPSGMKVKVTVTYKSKDYQYCSGMLHVSYSGPKSNSGSKKLYGLGNQWTGEFAAGTAEIEVSGGVDAVDIVKGSGNYHTDFYFYVYYDIKFEYMVAPPPVPGTITVSPGRSVWAGNECTLVLNRVGGSDGKLAVKYKFQTSTAIANQDFDYKKDVVTWADGDTSSRTIRTPTYETPNTWESRKQLRAKLSTLTTGAYAGYVAPTLAENKIYVDIIDNRNPGTIRVTKTESGIYRPPEKAGGYESWTTTAYFAPWKVTAGEYLRLTLSRVGGCDGTISVKYKTQTSTGILLQDYAYVKDILDWGDGDDSDRVILVPTYRNFNDPTYPKLLRVKLSTLATGSYWGNLVPRLDEAKIYVTMEEPEDGGGIVGPR